MRFSSDIELASLDDAGFSDLDVEVRWFTDEPPDLSRLAAPMELELWLDRKGHAVYLPEIGRGAGYRAWQIRQIAPVVAACFGRLTLHASSVETDDGVLAFVGGSGVGKSTTAKEAARAGATALSDDLLPIRFDGEEPHVPTETGRLPLTWVGFLRRHEGDLELRPLAGAEALELHLRNGFGEHGDPDAWAFQFDAYHRLVAATPHVDLAVPEGLGRLGTAVGRLLGATDDLRAS